MNMTLRTGVAVAMAMAGMAAGGAPAARAAVLYNSDPNFTRPAFASSPTIPQQQSSPFSLDLSATVTEVTWFGAYPSGASGPLTDDFTLSLYTGTGTPGSAAIASTQVLNLTRTDTGMTNTPAGQRVYLYSATLATPFEVSGATQYYLSIVNVPSFWFWQSGAAGSHFFRNAFDDNTPWTRSTTPVQTAFQLIGTPVPEPSALVLTSAAALSGAFVVRRRRGRVPLAAREG